jgi:hypothetical protein
LNTWTWDDLIDMRKFAVKNGDLDYWNSDLLRKFDFANQTRDVEKVRRRLQTHYEKLYDILYDVKYKDLPLYINETNQDAKAIVMWRLARGK